MGAEEDGGSSVDGCRCLQGRGEAGDMVDRRRSVPPHSKELQLCVCLCARGPGVCKVGGGHLSA